MKINLIIPPEKPIHDGAWNARLAQAEGKIPKEKADKLVQDARLRRRKRKATNK